MTRNAWKREVQAVIEGQNLAYNLVRVLDGRPEENIPTEKFLKYVKKQLAGLEMKIADTVTDAVT